MSFDKKDFKPYPDAGSLRASLTKKGEKSPDYWGNIAINMKDLTNVQTVDGLTVIKLSGWKKQDKQGKTYLSIAVDRFVPENRTGSAPQTRRQEDNLDDDIPF
jgi:hypothetical protein